MDDVRRERPDGLVVRTATAGEADAVVAMATDAFGESDVSGAARWFSGPGRDPADWAVACDGETIVASCGLLHHRLAVDGVAFDVGQLEYVVTREGYRNRGLVREMFAMLEARAVGHGHQALFIGGIPYFYRRFGYGYGLSYPENYLVDVARLEPDPAVSVRPATADDVDTLVGFESLRPTDGLRTVRSCDTWHNLVSSTAPGSYEQVIVAERDGIAVGWAFCTDAASEHRMTVGAAWASDVGGVDALVAYAAEIARPDEILVVSAIPGTVLAERVPVLGRRVTYDLGIYAKVPDPVALLTTLRPVLDARLARGGDAVPDGPTTLDLSLYHRGVALDLAGRRVMAVRTTAGNPDPFNTRGVGVAPDLFPALVFGRFGAHGLADRYDDVTLGRHGALMETLFPKLAAEVAGDF